MSLEGSMEIGDARMGRAAGEDCRARSYLGEREREDIVKMEIKILLLSLFL